MQVIEQSACSDPQQLLSADRWMGARRPNVLCSTLGLLSMLGVAASADAALFTVCPNGCDFPTIVAAVDAADFGDTISLHVELPQVHMEQGIVIEKNLTIRGQGRDSTIVQAAASVDEATDRIFEVREGASVFLEDMTLRHGNAANGGAVRVVGRTGFTSDLVARRVRFSDNRASANGGGLEVNFDATANVEEAIFEGNQAAFGGAACACGGDLALNESLIHANQAETGGGLAVGNGDLAGGNLTIVDNVATVLGGGIAIPAGTGSVRHVTVVGNAAPSAAGVQVRGLSVRNSVVAGNLGDDCLLVGTGADIDGWDGDGSCSPSVGSGDPELQPLADNGGPTWTMAPLEESPLLDAALESCNAVDQRGLDRDLGAVNCDLGAYERYELKTCEAVGVGIQDDDPVGLSSTVALDTPDSSIDRILDVNLSLWVDHPYVGDLSADLTHDGITVPLVDRPGVPASTYGCSGDDILATLDSSALDPVEDECEPAGFAIGGRFRPNGSLNYFNRRAGNGDWTFRVADGESGIVGTLLSWCVYVELFDELPEEPLFADGFESGAAGAWSSTAP